MSKIAIVYGTSTGVTESVAEKVKKALGGDADIYDAANVVVDDLKPYDFLFFAASTTGYGDLQDDWDALLPEIEAFDFTGKKVALIGLGDSASYPDTFVNGMGTIYEAIKDKAEIVGSVATEDYTYDDSTAVVDGKFVGLPLDDDNEFDQTDDRLSNWLDNIKQYL